MNVLSVSKEKGEAVIRFRSDELVLLEDSLRLAEKQLEISKRLEAYYKLQYAIRIAMDLSRYGHVDEWSFDRLAECRNKVKAIEDVFSQSSKRLPENNLTTHQASKTEGVGL